MIQSKSMPELMYIGSSENISKRWRGHISSLKYGRHSNKIQLHYDRFGLEDFDFILIDECAKEKLRELEQFYLTKHKPIWNIRYFAQRQRKNFTWTDSARENVSKLRNSKPKTPHILKGKKIDESWRMNISKGHIGLKHTEEHRRNSSNALKGKNAGAKGYRAKMVIQYDIDGNYITTYGAIREASRAIGLCPTFIRQCLIGKKKSAKFIFKYDTE